MRIACQRFSKKRKSFLFRKISWEPVCASEFLPDCYSLDKEQLYEVSGAKTKYEKEIVDKTLVALFEKIVNLMKKYPSGVLCFYGIEMFTEEELEYLEVLHSLGLIGKEEAVSYIDEESLVIDLGCFLLKRGQESELSETSVEESEPSNRTERRIFFKELMTKVQSDNLVAAGA